jgi:hypothetical protein
MKTKLNSDNPHIASSDTLTKSIYSVTYRNYFEGKRAGTEITIIRNGKKSIVSKLLNAEYLAKDIFEDVDLLEKSHGIFERSRIVCVQKIKIVESFENPSTLEKSFEKMLETIIKRLNIFKSKDSKVVFILSDDSHPLTISKYFTEIEAGIYSYKLLN